MKKSHILLMLFILFIATAFTTLSSSIEENAKPTYKIIVNHSTNSSSIEVGNEFVQTFDLSEDIHRNMFQQSVLALQLSDTRGITISTTDNGNSIQIVKK